MKYFALVFIAFITFSSMAQSTTYLALGDSYTIGESVPIERRWPVQLVNRMQSEGLDVEDPLIVAKTGWTTDELQKAITERNITGQFDLVSLLIGVNNQYRGYDFEQYEREFEALVKRAISFCNQAERGVFIVSIPDYGVTPFGQKKDPAKIALELDQYNAYAKRIAEEYGLAYYNITEISRRAKGDGSLVAEDSLHPSGDMYTLWVDLIFADVRAKVAK